MRKFPFLLFILTLALESCNTLYVPTTPSIPVFKKGNALKASASFGVCGLNANADYSPINHFYFGTNCHLFAQTYFNNQFSAGGHLGYYFNSASGINHSNFQLGYTFGSSSYADQWSGSDNQIGMAHGSYQVIYAQAFHALETGKGNLWCFGIRFDMYHAQYENVYHNIYANQLPIHTGFPMGFINYQYRFKKAPSLTTEVFLGVNYSTIDSGPNVGAAFYTYPVFRLGLGYHFQFGEKKNPENTGK